MKKTPISTNLEQGGKPDSCSALFNVYTYFSFFAAQRRGEGVRLCPLLRTASSSRSKNLRQRRPPWRKLSEHTFRISRPMFPSGPRYIVITKRLALREGYDSLSLSPSLSPFLSSSAEYQYDTFLYFWFLFESFLFPSLTFPRNHRCFSSKLATLITCKPLFCSFFSFPPFFLQYIVLCT